MKITLAEVSTQQQARQGSISAHSQISCPSWVGSPVETLSNRSSSISSSYLSISVSSTQYPLSASFVCPMHHSPYPQQIPRHGLLLSPVSNGFPSAPIYPVSPFGAYYPDSPAVPMSSVTDPGFTGWDMYHQYQHLASALPEDFSLSNPPKQARRPTIDPDLAKWSWGNALSSPTQQSATSSLAQTVVGSPTAAIGHTRRYSTAAADLLNHQMSKSRSRGHARGQSSNLEEMVRNWTLSHQRGEEGDVVEYDDVAEEAVE